METSAGKILDEACNRHNDVYCDEVLYAAWAEVPKVDAEPARRVDPASTAQAQQGIETFVARPLTC